VKLLQKRINRFYALPYFRVLELFNVLRLISAHFTTHDAVTKQLEGYLKLICFAMKLTSMREMRSRIFIVSF